jgi:serine/threonine-protein kinase
MPTATPTPASADRNLLFGILALQMDFIDQGALVRAMNASVLDKARPLGQVLCEQGALANERRQLLDALVTEHVRQHHGDPQKSLQAVSSAHSLRDRLQDIADADVQASLGLVSAGRPAEDPKATQAFAAGVPTAAGTRFRILRPHAEGGLGEVFIALDEELHREVALKQIRARCADDPASRARFVQEAQVTGGLEHPGVVPVHGLGHYADGRPFFAMRFIRGDSLKEAIERFHKADRPGRDPGECSLALRGLLGRFVDVCDAIAYAHGHGVLHRDLKPDNIMLGKYGETLVVDWGLAKTVEGPAGNATEPGEATLTPNAASQASQTLMGAVVGTPAYMSLEQAAGRLDFLGLASDAYSLGATLYALLTGVTPIEDPNVGTILQKVQRGEITRPRKVKSGVPRPLQAKPILRAPQWASYGACASGPGRLGRTRFETSRPRPAALPRRLCRAGDRRRRGTGGTRHSRTGRRPPGRPRRGPQAHGTSGTSEFLGAARPNSSATRGRRRGTPGM